MRRTTTASWIATQERWQINVQRDGVRRSFYSSMPGRTGQRECNGKADAWLDEGRSNENTRIETLYDKWMSELKATTGRNHWAQYEGYWKNWIDPAIGHMKISRLNEQHIQDIIIAAHKKGLAKKTLLNMRGCIASLVKFCRKNKATTLILENIYIPKGAPVGERVILQPGDIVKLFSDDIIMWHLAERRDAYVNAYRFEVVTGLRPGEVIGLKWEDIDNGKVTLKRSINRYMEETRGKNENARRMFALTQIAQTILDWQKQSLKQRGLISPWVFPSEQGEPINQHTYYHRWVRFRDQHGITKVTPYELRHTFVSVVKTLPEGFLKPLVGHSKDMDTYGTYGHEIAGEMEQAAQLVQDLFSTILKDVSRSSSL